MKLEKKQRNMFVFVIILIVIITVVGFVRFTGFALVIDDGGGGGTYIPPDPIPIPIPDPDPVPILEDPPNEPVLNVIASPTITGDIHISWNSVLDANNYAVYRSDDSISYAFLGKVYTNSYNDLIIEDGMYYYKIKAGNEGGISDYSNVESVIVQIPTVPNAPETNDITFEVVDSGVKITVSWNEVSCYSYKLYRSIESDVLNTGFVLIEEGLISTTYSEVLTDVGKYTYKVSAVNEYGESEQSNPTIINLTGENGSEYISDDYTILYIIFVILGILLVPVIIILTRKRKKKK